MSVFTSRRFNRHNVKRTATRPTDDRYLQLPTSGFNGNKFPGGVQGWIDQFRGINYQELRRRSNVLFSTNMYARGIVRCLVKNIIATGLNLESIPEESILGVPEDSLQDWTELHENQFQTWGKSKAVCDYKQRRTFGQMQRNAYREAIIGGDILVINRQDPITKLPSVEYIPGERVKTPPLGGNLTAKGNRLVDGVELDPRGRHVAFWVDQGDGYDFDNRYVRIEARGRNTGRLNAWLVYGCDTREDGVRGEPLLGIAIQPLLEIDKSRDAAQRKMSINSMIVGFIKNTTGAIGSLPIQSGSSKKVSTPVTEEAGSNPISVSEVVPGMFMERLGEGEEPTPYAISGGDVSFGPFEATIIHGLAWGIGVPPENLTLEFQSNYSASQAANSEFSIFINDERERFGSDFCDPIHADWFLSSVLLGKIQAPGFLEAVGDPMKFDIVQAWLGSDWTGAIKPSIDIVKQATGYGLQVEMGACTRDRMTRNINGSKFSKNVRRLQKENSQLMEALTPIFEAKQKYGEAVVDGAMKGAVAYLRSVKDEDDDEMATPAK